MSKSTTSCLNKQLTLEQKKAVMLKDLQDELKVYKGITSMKWWVIRLEAKIEELKNECNKAS